MRENGLVKPGIINLLGKDGTKWEVNLRREANGTMYLGKGWKDFTIANGLKTGESFTLEAVLENGTRMLSLVSTQSTSDRNQQGECLKDSEKESNSTEPSSGKRKAMINRGVRRKSFPASMNRFVTLTLTDDNLIKYRRVSSSINPCFRGYVSFISCTHIKYVIRSFMLQYLPLSFTRDNGLDKPGMIFLLGKTGRKWEANLQREASGRIVLTGKGWKEFAMANGLKSGELFTLEAILEKGTPMLSLVNTQSTNYRSQQGECSRDSEKESSICAEPSRGNKKWKATNNRKETRDSSSAIQNQYVTLTLTPEDVRACTVVSSIKPLLFQKGVRFCLDFNLLRSVFIQIFCRFFRVNS